MEVEDDVAVAGEEGWCRGHGEAPRAASYVGSFPSPHYFVSCSPPAGTSGQTRALTAAGDCQHRSGLNLPATKRPI
jgi:hypothetical protein